MGISSGRVAALGWQNQLRYAGIELMLLIQYALEQLGFRVSDTHPEASRRLEVIRSRARATSKGDHAYDNLTAIARVYEKIFVTVVGRYHQPDLDHDFYTGEANAAVEGLRKALMKYSAAIHRTTSRFPRP